MIDNLPPEYYSLIIYKAKNIMKYTIDLNDQQVEVLKSILAQIEPTRFIVAPTSKPKKLSKIDQTIQDRREYRANKANKKRNNNNK